MKAALERISEDVSQAMLSRSRLNIKFGVQLSQADKKEIARACRAYRKALKSLDRAFASGSKTAITEALERVLSGFAGRFLSILRASSHREKQIPFAAIENWSKELTLHTAYHEPVAIWPEPSKPGSWRPIGNSGPRRRAQQLLLRDVFLVTLGDSHCDSTVSGAGGEARLFNDVKQAIGDGYHYWVSLDIRNFFPSLRPGHLSGHPLPNWMIEHLVFLPSATPIRFVDPRYGVELSEQAILKGDDADLPQGYPYTMGSIGSMLNMVRQGLIQGDVCAPQIARTVLGRELQQTLGKWGVWYRSHLDDVLIGASSQTELEASIQALTYRLKSHPAGPLELHEHAISHVTDGFYHLGYRVILRKDGSVHTYPALKRFSRFRERLFARLECSTAFTKEELLKIGINYAGHWFRAQQAWTKTGSSWGNVVGEVTECVNKFIANEFIQGIGNWNEDDIHLDLVWQ